MLDEPQDPATVRFFLIRGLTMPAIFLLSIVVSLFSAGAAIWTWFIMIVLDAIVSHRSLILLCRHPFLLPIVAEGH